MADEKVLRIEAQAAVREVSFAVNFVEISKLLPSSNDVVYMNITTKENDSYCIELSVQGFRIVGHHFERIDDAQKSRFYETIYALLDDVSAEYRCSFGDALATRLNELAQTPTVNNEEEK